MGEIPATTARESRTWELCTLVPGQGGSLVPPTMKKRALWPPDDQIAMSSADSALRPLPLPKKSTFWAISSTFSRSW